MMCLCALLSIHFPPTILHCSWVIKQGESELDTFPAFSPLRAGLKGSCAACLSLSAIRRSGRPRVRGREGGEVGWTLIARSERNLCIWSRAFCVLACQRGDFFFRIWKHACPPTPTRCWWKVWVFGRHCWMENWHLWLCAAQTNPFCLYLLTSIPKRQLEGLELVTHTTVDGGVALLYSIIPSGSEIIHLAMMRLPDDGIYNRLYKYKNWLEPVFMKTLAYRSLRD